VDAYRRNQYLGAMGIDVWVRRPDGPLAGLQGATEALAATETLAATEEATALSGAVDPGGAAGPDAPAPLSTTPVDLVSTTPVDLEATVTSLESPDPLVSRAPDAPNSGDTAVAWEALRTEILSCTKCGLHKTRTQGVVGVGPHRTDWMVIGEAPGAEEDRKGEPFVGRAGQLLDAMLRAIGLDRGTTVYIANVLKSRPPGNRDPKPEEVAACLPYLMRQIALLRPRLMLAVGRIAAQNLLSTDMPLGRLRGKVHYFGELNTPLIVTYHPAYLLRTPADKRKAWEDLKFARSVFRQLTGRVGTNGVLS